MPDRRVAILVPNLFTRVPVDTAVRGLNAEAVAVSSLAAARESACGVVVVDLSALDDRGVAEIEPLVAAGAKVLAFGPHVDATRLAAARRAGATALPRGAFLARLPDLLDEALA